MSPLINSQSVVYFLANDSEQFATDRVLSHFFIVAVLREQLHAWFQFQIVPAGFRTPAERGVRVFHRIMMTAVLLKEGITPVILPPVGAIWQGFSLCDKCGLYTDCS